MKTSPVFSLGVIRGAILITALGSKDLCHLADSRQNFGVRLNPGDTGSRFTV